MNDGKKRTIKRVIQRCSCDKILPLTLVYIFYVILHAIHSSEIYLFSGAFAGVVVTLSAWKSALFEKISLSERSEFEIFANAFSRFSDT